MTQAEINASGSNGPLAGCSASGSSWHGTQTARPDRRDDEQRHRHRQRRPQRQRPAGARARQVRRLRLRHPGRHAVGGRRLQRRRAGEPRPAGQSDSGQGAQHEPRQHRLLQPGVPRRDDPDHGRRRGRRRLGRQHRRPCRQHAGQLPRTSSPSAACATSAARSASPTSVRRSRSWPRAATASTLLASEPCLYPIMTTSNSGTTTPVAGAAGAVYTDSFAAPTLGTSFAAPLVAGTAGLMLSRQAVADAGRGPFAAAGLGARLPDHRRQRRHAAMPGAERQRPARVLLHHRDLRRRHARRAGVGGRRDRRAGADRGDDGHAHRRPAGDGRLQLGDRCRAERRAICGRSSPPATTGATITGATHADTVTVAPTAAGTFTIRLTTTDDNGHVSTASHLGHRRRGDAAGDAALERRAAAAAAGAAPSASAG